MPKLTCNRCGLEDTMMVDAPHLDDPRVYCITCYSYLFPPGWTDEIELPEPDRSGLVFLPFDDEQDAAAPEGDE